MRIASIHRLTKRYEILNAIPSLVGIHQVGVIVHGIEHGRFNMMWDSKCYQNGTDMFASISTSENRPVRRHTCSSGVQ